MKQGHQFSSRYYLIIILLLLTRSQIFAQKVDQINYANDVEVGVGIQGAPNTGKGVDLRIDMTYARFYNPGVGFRTGLTYMPVNLGIKNSVGVPIYFAWRNFGVNREARVEIDDAIVEPYYEKYDRQRNYNDLRYGSFEE